MDSRDEPPGLCKGRSTKMRYGFNIRCRWASWEQLRGVAIEPDADPPPSPPVPGPTPGFFFHSAPMSVSTRRVADVQ